MLLHTFPMFNIQFIIYIPVVVISSISTLTEIGQQYNGLLIFSMGSTGPLSSGTIIIGSVNPTMISAKIKQQINKTCHYSFKIY